MALWALASGAPARLFRAMGVDEFMRGTGLQVEPEAERAAKPPS